MNIDSFDRAIIDSIDEGVVILENATVIHVNHAMEIMTGMTRFELAGLPLGRLLDPMPALEVSGTADRQARHANETALCESNLAARNGAVREVGVSVHTAPDGRPETAFVIIRDNAERKKMQKELLKSRQLESIAALSGGIAHDYNNLLTAIMGNISLVLTGVPEDDAICDWLSQALDAALIAKELTNRLITFSKGGAPRKETIDIAGLVESATEFALSGANIVAEFEIAPELWCADVDRTQIGQAFHNLIINAREAMPGGGTVFVRAENHVSDGNRPLLKAGRYVAVSIRDQGGGIAPDALERIFDPYFSTKDMGGQRGMGLGLSIANSIIEQHDGVIAVESAPGEGALFTIFLPASPSKPVASANPPRSAPAASPPNGARILVMDDEAMIRTLAGSMLGKMGFQTALAGTGEEAIEAYETALSVGRPFDLVILDLTVKGGMGGKETIQRLRAIDPHVKAIVSSGYADDPGVTRFADYGFHGVVAKPYRFDELRQQIAVLLRR